VEKTEGTGERVGGYRVVRRLATGGTSDVLLAKAEGPHGFERSVVLKLLLSQYKHDEEFKGMFAREAAAYARLSHPSIVRLYDFFANDDQLVMVLEYIDGPPLSRLRGMLKAVGQAFDDATSIFVATSIFEALAAAHAANDDSGEPAPVIHRDVNPSNVLIPWDGHVKLADFGIAKVTGANHQSSAGLIKGTYGYMAPEQVKGETVTPRADVYAGAIILWELLTRRRAFIRGALPEIEVLRQLAEPRIVSIDVLRPDVDKGVREAIKRALEPRAETRRITAEEMVSVLRAAVPSDEGRERLANALAAVRHEPKPSPTTIPPAQVAADDLTTGKVFPREKQPSKPGMLPKMTPAPRPAVGSVGRTTAAYGGPRPPSGLTPRAPGVAAPRPRAAGDRELPATMKPAELVQNARNEAVVGAAPAVRDTSDDAPLTEATPSSVPGLASVLEPSDPHPFANPSSLAGPAALPLFDNLVEPPELVKATGRASERLRLGTPLAGVAPGRPLHDAIDEILRDSLPSNVPPNVFPKTDPPGGVPESPTRKDQKALADPMARELGKLPAAPPPLNAASPHGLGPQGLGSTLVVVTGEPGPGLQRALPSSFPAMNRTLSMNERVDVRAPGVPSASEIAHAEKPTERPPPHLMVTSTSPMPPVPPPMLSPSTAKMRAFVVPQEALGSMPPPAPATMGSSPPATLPLGTRSPSPSAPAPPPLPPSVVHTMTGSHPPLSPAHRSTNPGVPIPGSLSGAHASIPTDSTRPQRRGSPVLAGVGVLLLSIAAGVAGVVGYVRWQKSHVVASVVPPATTAFTPASSSAVIATQATTTSTSRSPFAQPDPPTVSASPPAPALASASPPASAAASSSASAPASAPAEDVPAGMGRVRTTGAAPGRRIFVDERTVGQTPESVVVKCGSRAIKLGSAGSTQTVDVPCGGEITVGDR
jgi:serine/threonine protein kinase